jgi:hypothetical protein
MEAKQAGGLRKQASNGQRRIGRYRLFTTFISSLPSWPRTALGRARYEKTTAGTSVFVFKTMFSTQACFLRKNGLFFDLRILELRVEKKKHKKKYTRDTGGAGPSPSSPPAQVSRKLTFRGHETRWPAG